MQAEGGTVEPNMTGKKWQLDRPMWPCLEQRPKQGESTLYEEVSLSRMYMPQQQSC